MDKDYPRFFADVSAVFGWKQQWSVFEDLREAYNMPPRAYHNLDHINYCLDALDKVYVYCDAPAEIAMALWFHDVIYHPLSETNEADSVVFARDALFRLNVSRERTDNIARLIMATKHDGTLMSHDEEMIADIDLVVLAESKEFFAETGRKVFKEYHGLVPRDAYFAGRADFFEGLLNRGRIFYSEHFYEMYEATAEKNLRAEIAMLRVPRPGPLRPQRPE